MPYTTFMFSIHEFKENTYLIWDGDKNCTIVDSGCSDEHERKCLVDFTEPEGLKPIKLINTECHIDHVLSNKFLAEKYHLGLEMHKLDLPALNAVPNYGKSGCDTREVVELS
ncbi:MAG: hydroxyacylglutathione hydrolase [Bacteroidia bacterium]|jgi:hydroxyacylglutathione hydrolase